MRQPVMLSLVFSPMATTLEKGYTISSLHRCNKSGGVWFLRSELTEVNYFFRPHTGRKLYAYVFDLAYERIQVRLTRHHLLYGDMKGHDMFNWAKKVEVVSRKAGDTFTIYPGGRNGFFTDFHKFFADPRRFTYTPLIICKGVKPTPAPSLPRG